MTPFLLSLGYTRLGRGTWGAGMTSDGPDQECSSWKLLTLGGTRGYVFRTSVALNSGGGGPDVSTASAPAVGTLACLSSLFPLCLSISPCPMTLIQTTDLWDQDS